MDPSTMKVPELRAELTTLGIATKGLRKAELVQLLEDKIKNGGQAPSGTVEQAEQPQVQNVAEESNDTDIVATPPAPIVESAETDIIMQVSEPAPAESEAVQTNGQFVVDTQGDDRPTATDSNASPDDAPVDAAAMFLEQLDQKMAHGVTHEPRRERPRERSHDRERSRRHEYADRSRHRDERSREADRYDRRRDYDRSHDRVRGRDYGHDHEREHRQDRSRDHRSRHRDDRRRHRSPSPRTGHDHAIVPIHKRQRKLNNWDVPPPGYEQMSAQQAKMSGAFATRSMLLSGQLMASGGLPSGIHSVPDPAAVSTTAGAMVSATNPLYARQQRRLYVGNIPFSVTEAEIVAFFNDAAREYGLADASDMDLVTCAHVNLEKNFAFVEFRTPELATAGMGFDGITYRDQVLKVRRPKDYIFPEGHEEAEPRSFIAGAISDSVPNTENKLYIGGIPEFLKEEQVMELLKTFGELSAFHLVKDLQTSASKGYAFCEYVDHSITPLACKGLTGMEIGGKQLVVQPAHTRPERQHTSSTGPAKHLISLINNVAQQGTAAEPSTIVQLLNMVVPDELIDDMEYQEILDDVREECSRFGNIVEVRIPRPSNGANVAGVGKIFIKYRSPDEAIRAFRALAGRKFADRTVLTSFLSEESFYAEDY